MLNQIKSFIDSSLEEVFHTLPENMKDQVVYFANQVFRISTRFSLLAEQKEVIVDDASQMKINYLDCGKRDKEIVVYFHGFSDSKYGFVMTAKNMLDKYRVIIPDLPGFGENKIHKHLVHDLDHYRDWLAVFLQKAVGQKVHLVGNSLGGGVAAALAIEHPDLIKSLTLIGSAGVMPDEPVGVYEQLRQGHNVFAVTNEKEFVEFYNGLFYHKARLPYLLYHSLYKKYIDHREWYDKIMNDLTAGVINDPDHFEQVKEGLLNKGLHKIKAPTLIIWGEYDSYFPIEIAKIFEQEIENSRLKVIKRAGHVPHVEKKGEFLKLFDTFIKHFDTK